MLLSNELLVILGVALLLVVILVALIPRSDKRKDNDVSASDPIVEEFPAEQVTVTLPRRRKRCVLTKMTSRRKPSC
jgi:hypothetical protein